MDVFREIEIEFVRRRDAGQIDSWFADLKQRRAELATFESLASLIAVCRDPSPQARVGKDAIDSVLCLEATGDAHDELAGLVLLWLFLPGLRNAARYLSSTTSLEAPDVAAEMIAGFWESAGNVTSSSTHIARRLLHTARRRALAAIRRQGRWNSHHQTLGEEDDVPPHTWPSEDSDDLLSELVAARVVSAEDAELLRAEPGTLTQLATEKGCSRDVVYARRSRTRRKLRRWLTQARAAAPDGSTGSNRSE